MNATVRIYRVICKTSTDFPLHKLRSMIKHTWHRRMLLNQHPMASLRFICYNKGKSTTRFCSVNVWSKNWTTDSRKFSLKKWPTRTPSLRFDLAVPALCRRLLLPVIIVPDRVVQKLLDQRSTPQGAGKGKVSLGRLLNIIRELGGTEPTLLSLNFTVLSSPSNLFAPKLKVSLRSLPYAL